MGDFGEQLELLKQQVGSAPEHTLTAQFVLAKTVVDEYHSTNPRPARSTRLPGSDSSALCAAAHMTGRIQK